jgi:hypothetical protein
MSAAYAAIGFDLLIEYTRPPERPLEPADAAGAAERLRGRSDPC